MAEKSRTKSDFNKSVKFNVLEFRLQTTNHSVGQGIPVIGGKNSSAYSGQSYTALIKVIDLEPKTTPVQELVYHGVCHLRAGDKISATLCPVDESVEFEEQRHVYDDGHRTTYNLRPLKEKEVASEIRVLDPQDLEKVLATYSL